MKCTPQKNEPNMIRNQDAPMTDHYVNTYLNWITLDACETRRRSNKGGALYLLSHWFQAYILTSTSQNKQYATRLCKKIANESVCFLFFAIFMFFDLI